MPGNETESFDKCADCGITTGILIWTSYDIPYCRRCTFIKEEDKRNVAKRERERMLRGKKPLKKGKVA